MKQLSDYKLNPDNPRTITPAQLDALKKSLKDFPRMMGLRPIVVDENNVALGGNMRLTGLAQLGYTEVPDEWIVRADDLTAKQKREFVVKDNLPAGAWDWEALQEWDTVELVDWGLELSDDFTQSSQPESPLQTEEIRPLALSHFLISVSLDKADLVLPLIQQLKALDVCEVRSTVN